MAGGQGTRLRPLTSNQPNPHPLGLYLDITHPEGIAVMPDLSYAFVADWGPVRFEPQYQSPDPSHPYGGKIGVIQDPFGLQGTPKLVGSTTPEIGRAHV